MNWIKRHRWLSAFLIAAVLFLGWRQYDRRFTPERWAETDISHRGKLVSSLLKQYGGLVGMTQAEVEAFLLEHHPRLWRPLLKLLALFGANIK